MRRMIIAGNWKMNMDAGSAGNLAKGIVGRLGSRTEPVVVLCPPFPLLSTVNLVVKDSPVKLGGQNLHHEEKGAFTGEVSDVMLDSVGCSYVIIGHSERRSIFGETDEFLNKKLLRTLSGNLTPIFCIGETLEERETGKTFDVVKRQIKRGLKDIELKTGQELVIAYEPVWAIGTGKTATPEQAEEVHLYIRELLIKRFDEKIADNITVQYGGSMKPENAKELLSKPNIDGGLIGGASLKADAFNAIIDSA